MVKFKGTQHYYLNNYIYYINNVKLITTGLHKNKNVFKSISNPELNWLFKLLMSVHIKALENCRSKYILII